MLETFWKKSFEETMRKNCNWEKQSNRKRKLLEENTLRQKKIFETFQDWFAM